MFFKLFILLSCRLYDLREVNELGTSYRRDEVLVPFLPGVLELNKTLNQIRVIFELWVHYLYILVIFAKQLSEVVECLSDLVSQLSDCFRLRRGYPSTNTLSRQEDV